MSYTVLYNQPGYMPTMEPFEVGSATDAIMALCIEVERYGMETDNDEVARLAFTAVSDMERNEKDWANVLSTRGMVSLLIGEYVFEARHERI